MYISMAEGTDKEQQDNREQEQQVTEKSSCCPSISPAKMDKDSTEDIIENVIISTSSPPIDFTREKSKTPPPTLKSSKPLNNETENNNNNNIDNNVSQINSIKATNGDSETHSTICNGEIVENGIDCDDDPRRHIKSSSLPHGVKLCTEASTSSSSTTLNSSNNDGTSGNIEVNGENGKDKWVCLEEELLKAQAELKKKDAEVEELKGIRQQVEGELEDLTASLFEEAHKMVNAAKTKEVQSEKSLKEAKMQLDGLQAEVAALKTLLITSTPSRPNLSGVNGGNGISIFKKQHKRCPSHNHLQYGRREDDETDSKEKAKNSKSNEVVIEPERCEVDPAFHAMFVLWRQEPTLTVNHNNNKSQFLQKIYTEDIEPCLSFSNEVLVNKLRQAVEENSIWVEPLPEKDKLNVPTECALLRCPRICNYRMRFAFDSDEWYDISQLCRDRIAAVCEFLNYLRYIKNGLVKASNEDSYWEIIRLRKQIALAKLGIRIS